MVTLTTEHLVVRQATLDDLDAILDFARRNRVFHAPYEPIREDWYFAAPFWQERIVANERNYREGKHLELFLFKKEEPGRAIGRCAFSNFVRGVFQACHLGYVMDEQEQGKGYMTEALKAGIAYMFEVENFHRIMANFLPSNAASGAVLKKLGFTVEGTAKDYLRIAGQWEDHVLTALVNKEWREA